MAIQENDFSCNDLESSEALLVTGTHFSTEEMFHISKRAVAFAKSVGTKVILDIDYHPVLWGLRKRYRYGRPRKTPQSTP
jgi:5-dehydro-2-deoxygluconokinase